MYFDQCFCETSTLCVEQGGDKTKLVKSNVVIRIRQQLFVRAYPGFCSIKQLGAYSPWMGMLVIAGYLHYY
jgi:hypothetical protein